MFLLDNILTTLGEIGSIGTAIGTIALVFLFWRTISQLEETVKLSKIQANYRFRPWVGPLSGIQLMSSDGSTEQFSITVRNYGELPATSVVANYVMNDGQLSKKDMTTKKFDTFNLGPLLPNMEKKYWFFIPSELIQKTKSGISNVHILLYFTYEHHGGKSEYGLVSRFDAKTNSFIHSDMWID